MQPFADKFWSRVHIAAGDACWEWTGARTQYGNVQRNGKTANAHRVAWELTYGPVPPGRCVLHWCDNTLCCRPDHLFLGTQKMNVRDAIRKGRARGRLPRGPAVDLASMQQSPTHPGEMFEEEYRKPSGLSQAEAARRMGMSTNRLNELVKGKRSVTAETALLFAAISGTSPEFWMALQANYDLWHALQKAKSIRRTLPGEPFPRTERR